MVDRPLVGWLLAEIVPDGSLDQIGRPKWRAVREAAPPCDRLPRPREHLPPVPGCVCGLYADYSLEIAYKDEFRDRVGYRMRTFATVILWGRIQLGRLQIRAEWGHVVALAGMTDDAAPRRERLTAAAERLGAEVFELDPSVPNTDEMVALAHLAGDPVSPGELHALGVRSLGLRELELWVDPPSTEP